MKNERKKDQISSSSYGWEIVMEDDTIWVTDALLSSMYMWAYKWEKKKSVDVDICSMVEPF